MADVSATPVATADVLNVEQKTAHDDVPESPAPHEMSIKEYCLTRLSTLKPPMHSAPNPFRLLMMLNGKQWLFFLVGFLAWVCYCDFSC
jgi:SHS family lactate transporter-like MFS transporter